MHSSQAAMSSRQIKANLHRHATEQSRIPHACLYFYARLCRSSGQGPPSPVTPCRVAPNSPPHAFAVLLSPYMCLHYTRVLSPTPHHHCERPALLPTTSPPSLWVPSSLPHSLW